MAAVPGGLDMCWGWCGLLRAIRSSSPRCLELLLSSISPAAPTPLSWGLAKGFSCLFIKLQMLLPDCWEQLECSQPPVLFSGFRRDFFVISFQ